MSPSVYFSFQNDTVNSGCIITRNGHIPWSLRSPDLTLTTFLLGYLKTKVFWSIHPEQAKLSENVLWTILLQWLFICCEGLGLNINGGHLQPYGSENLIFRIVYLIIFLVLLIYMLYF